MPLEFFEFKSTAVPTTPNTAPPKCVNALVNSFLSELIFINTSHVVLKTILYSYDIPVFDKSQWLLEKIFSMPYNTNKTIARSTICK